MHCKVGAEETYHFFRPSVLYSLYIFKRFGFFGCGGTWKSARDL